ncbi:ubiquitin carboxyl-terminal hydrolase 26-like isoform X2 [Salmo trutta]|uniref:ubiquitin carboxyl-terminal hydrolase 26-like isoform X2 n=1 Tax=Salmo trutta TaxID=8032 RepID=UPI00113119B1|nr:ubiquitin carboxyl-terminal hydrolase 26-like isoform X2 [Salmo trutta]
MPSIYTGQAPWGKITWTTHLQTPRKAPLIDQRHQPDNIYKLSSVISHLGDNMCTGHYISDVLDSRGSGWLCLDDAHVSRTDEATVLRATAQTAYILFYVCSGAGEGDQAPHY